MKAKLFAVVSLVSLLIPAMSQALTFDEVVAGQSGKVLGASTGKIAPSRVLIIYNTNWTDDSDRDGVQDSLEVANYYMQKRGVPSTNLLGLAFSDSVAYSDYALFKTQVLTPIQNKLNALGQTNIDVIMFSYGSPYKVNTDSIDSVVMAPFYFTGSGEFQTSNPYLEPTPGFGSDHGNFSHSSYKINNTNMYLVTRLDGPGGIGRSLGEIDEAMYADKYFSTQPGYYKGTAYVDTQGRLGDYTDSFLASNSYVQNGDYNSYEGADINQAWAEHFEVAAGMPLKWEKGGATIGTAGAIYQDGSSAATAPNAFLYDGWYNLNSYHDAFSWLPGSVANDLNSSGFYYGLRGTTSIDWATQAIYHGATAVSGVTDEPYVNGTVRAAALMDYITSGYSYAEAAGASMPYLGWKVMYVGDPLYAPFAAKTLVMDTSAPHFAAGFPRLYHSEAEGNQIEVKLDESADPEVAKAKIDYGTTTNYGQTYTTQYYSSNHKALLPNLTAGATYHYNVTLTDPAGNTTSSGDLTFVVPAQLPFGGTAWAIPGSVNFTDFDTGGEGIAYHDVNPTNYTSYQLRAETGVEIASWDPTAVWNTSLGEWLEYTVNVNQTGTYKADFNVCNGCIWSTANGVFHMEVDGTDVTGPLTFPTATAVWANVTKSGINLSAGSHVIKISMDAPGEFGAGSFHSMTFTLTGSGGGNPPTISSFSASPTSITAGQSSTLSWNATGATSLSINQGVGDVTGQTSKSITPTANTKYILTATNSSGSVTASTTVSVAAATDTQAPSVPTNLSANTLSSTAANISWSASTDNVGVSGYNIFKNGNLLVTTNALSYQDSTLAPSTSYSYTVSAIDAAGNQSAQSAPASVTTPAAADVTPPVLTRIYANYITSTSTEISWTTDELSTTFVDYGLTTSYGQTVGYPNSPLVTLHSIGLLNLAPASTYHFRVRSADASGNQAASSDNAFSTPPDNVPNTDTYPAAIQNLSAVAPSRSSVKLNWTSPGNDGNIGTALYYDIRYSTAPITETNWSAATQVTGEPQPLLAGSSQSYTVVGLLSGIKYYFGIKTVDTTNHLSSLSNVVSAVTKVHGKK